MMDLTHLPRLQSKRRAAKRIGRGYGSGKGGHTVGRGQKGQKVRGRINPGFEGGQLPLGKRLPVRKGFRRGKRRMTTNLNLGDLASFKAGAVIGPASLREAGLLPKRAAFIKILAEGPAPRGLIFRGVTFSKKAQEKIKAAGVIKALKLKS